MATPLKLNLLFLIANACILLAVLAASGYLLRGWKWLFSRGLAHSPLLAWTPWARRQRMHQYCLQAPAAPPEAVTLRVGRNLHRLIDPRSEQNLLAQVGWLRKEVHRELGLLLPGAKLSDHLGLDGNEYVLTIHGQEAARGKLYQRYLAAGPEAALRSLAEPSWHTFHPLTGQTAAWITEDRLFAATELGCMVMAPSEVLAFHLRHAIWQHAPRFITPEFTRHFLKRASELEPELTWQKTMLETHVPRLQKTLQAVVELGGNLKNPPALVRAFEGHLRRTDEPEMVGKRILESLSRPAANPRDEAALAGALLYTAHWNEMLCLELFPLMDHNQLSQLTSGLLTMQHSPGPVMERLWNELGPRLESSYGRSYQELAEQIQQLLKRGLEPPQPLAPIGKLAVLILSLPRSCGPELAQGLLRQLPRPAAGELTAALGRYAPVWSEAPFRADGRQNLEVGLRERTVAEFLDFLASRRSDAAPPIEGRDLLRAQVRRLARTDPEGLALALEWFYFPPVEPLSRFQALVELKPSRIVRELLAFWRSGAASGSAGERAAAAMTCLNPEVRASLRSRLRGRGCSIPESTSSDEGAALVEFMDRYRRHMGRRRVLSWS